MIPDHYAEGLVSPDDEATHAVVQQVLHVAYEAVVEGQGRGVANFALWQKGRSAVAHAVEQRMKRNGIEASPFDWESLVARVAPVSAATSQEEHLQLVRALLTDGRRLLVRHIQYRLKTDGNVHLEFCGSTGLGKSSAAIGLADAMTQIEAGALANHLSFDLADLPRRLEGKKPGQAVVQDEFVQVTGEGARTTEAMFANLEDTLRASQVSLFVLSPRRKEHGTMQATLEAIGWNRERRFTFFLLWLRGMPVATVALPWCREALWLEYGPWKANNLQRSLAGQFKDNTPLIRAAVAALEDERIASWIASAANRPKKKDFEDAVEWFPVLQNLATSQRDRVVDMMTRIAFNYERLRPHMEAWWGVTGGPRLAAIAKKCQED